MTDEAYLYRNLTEVAYCPFCGADRGNLMLITTTSPGVEPKGEDWYCDMCRTFFTISDVAKKED
jgi:hypothetical protein